MRLRSTLITALASLAGCFVRPLHELPAQPRRIVLVKPCCLGDVLFTTPLLRSLRRHFPAAHITYAVGPWSYPMVATNRDVDAGLLLPERWTGGSVTAVVRSLRAARFDLAVVPDRSPLLSFITVAAGIPMRAGLDSAGRGFGYNLRTRVPDGVVHEADLYSLVARSLAIGKVDRCLSFDVAPQARAAAGELAANVLKGRQRLVVLHPGGGANPGMTLARKRWLPSRWASIADRLATTYNAAVLLVGGPGDKDAVAAVQVAMQRPAEALVHRWEWSVLAGLLERADLFLGHDTGMLHLACAVGTPAVAVFGPSDPQMYGPYSEHGVAVWKPTPPSPCFVDGWADPACPCDYQCMRAVSVDDVWQAVQQLLPQP
ncbi:MAG: glycosyltransferase family 9 protein [Herpetosiphon sp.]